MKFWKKYFELMNLCYHKNSKLLTILIFSNPLIVIIMFKFYLENNRGEMNL